MTPEEKITKGWWARLYAVGVLKKVLFALVFSALVLAFATLFQLTVYPRLLPLEGKIKRGYGELAKREVVGQLKARKTPEATARLVKALLLSGNIGRADLLARIYGVEDKLLTEVRHIQKRAIEDAKKKGKIENPFHNETSAIRELKGYPVYANLKFFLGYQLALLGDWNGAGSYFLEAKRDKVSVELQEYLDYYLARFWLVKGDDRKRKNAEIVLARLSRIGSPELRRRALLNLIEINLENKNVAKAQNLLEKLSEEEGSKSESYKSWVGAKAFLSFADYYEEKGDYLGALRMLLESVKTDENSTRRSAGLKALNVLKRISGSEVQLLTEKELAGFNELAKVWIREGEFSQAGAELEKLLTKFSQDARRRIVLLTAVADLYRATGREGQLKRILEEASGLCAGVAEPKTLGYLQRIILTTADFYESQGKYNVAEQYLKMAISIRGEFQNSARMRLARLLRKSYPFSREAERMQILREVVKEKDEYFLEAGEELIPLLLLAEKYPEAMELSKAIAERDRALSSYWLKFIRKKMPNADGSAQIEPRPSVRNFSFYELADTTKLESEHFEELASDEEVYEVKEGVEEYLLGVFLTELALERMKLKTQKEAPFVAQAIWLRNLELTSPKNVSSWNATSIIEGGALEGAPKEIFKYILQTAFPRPYIDEVRDAQIYYGVPVSLIYAVMKKESNFSEDAVSRAGAVGLMQLMPATASLYLEQIPSDLRARPLTDPKKNIFLGTAYLKSMKLIFGEDYLAIAGYNAGPGTLKRHIESLSTNQKELIIETLPSKETQEFVKKVLKYARIYEFVLEETGER